jgi:hypothetical protein
MLWRGISSYEFKGKAGKKRYFKDPLLKQEKLSFLGKNPAWPPSFAVVVDYDEQGFISRRTFACQATHLLFSVSYLS